MFLIFNKFSKVFIIACLAQVFLCGANLAELEKCGLIAAKGSVHIHTPYSFDCCPTLPTLPPLPPLPNGLPSLDKIHAQMNRLKHCNIRGANEHKQRIIADYKACLTRIKSFQKFERYWTEHEVVQLTCYEISILLGCANVYGSARDNQNQLDCAKEAYDLLQQFNRDVNNAYVDGRRMSLDQTKQAALGIMNKARTYGRLEQVKH
jgi:hypothetical protein